MNSSRLALSGRLGATASLLLQQLQQQQQQRLLGGAAFAAAGVYGRHRPQQHVQQQVQQQRQQKPKAAGHAALVSAMAAFCVSSGARRETKLGDVSDFPEGGVYEVSVNDGKQRQLSLLSLLLFVFLCLFLLLFVGLLETVSCCCCW